MFIFFLACRSGTYGTGCHEMCGYCLEEQTCFYINGTCLNGCAPGFYGDLCKTGTFTSSLVDFNSHSTTTGTTTTTTTTTTLTKKNYSKL